MKGRTLVLAPGCRLYAGLPKQQLKSALSRARRVALHAGHYANFSEGTIDQLLRQRLQSRQLSQLLIVTQELESEAGLAFGKMLRPEFTEMEILEEYRVSQHWSKQLASSWPEQVTAVSSKLAASAPLLLLDDQLFVGHYAHSPHLAPLGLWLKLDSRELGLPPAGLWQRMQGRTKVAATPWQQALYRYADELAQVLKQAGAQA
ncbi:hypothetical protein AAEH84_16335 [Shewanella indica]|uniref:hypothetical protein n=1 Tax=Shewanella indica TaxID=768528 RepID=UPI00313BFE91